MKSHLLNPTVGLIFTLLFGPSPDKAEPLSDIYLHPLSPSAMPNSLCRHEGCTKHAQKMGVCVTHGAIIVRKLCSHEGCAKKSQNSGLCITHGARVKCRIKGCYNNNIKGGHCITHRTKVSVRLRKQCIMVAQNESKRVVFVGDMDIAQHLLNLPI